MTSMQKTFISVFLSGVLLCFYSWTIAQQPVKVSKTKTPPLIDGNLNDVVWQRASIFKNFKTMHPEPGLPPSEPTEVYLTYDRENIYAGFRCFNSEPEKIIARAPTRDNPENDDWIAFCLEASNDELGAHFFLVNPLGVQSDGTLNAEGSPNATFNAEWSSAARITDNGYEAEMAIPFTRLPFVWKENLTMGFKVARFISRISEEVDFPEIHPDRGQHLSQFQKIEFSGIEKSHVSTVSPIVNIKEMYLQKISASKQQDITTLDGRCHAWGEAAVIDYLLFPSHGLKAGTKAFHFEKNLNEERVASLFQSLEYSSGKRIENLERFLTRTQTTAFIVIKNDTIVYENYFNGYGRDSIVTSFSVAKSFASTLIGIAIDEELIKDVRDPITKYLPELKARDQRFAQITIRDLLLMSGGLKYEEDAPERDDEITYYHPDLRKAALEETKIVAPPGSYFLYNNYNPLLIGMILERATGKTVTQYLQEKIWQPLGMEYSGSWSTDSDAHQFEKMESGINARAIDFAKFGRLFLNDGRWGDKQIISSKWIHEAMQPEATAQRYYPPWQFFSSNGGYYKYFWWGKTRANGKSDFFAMGNRGQYIYISPQKKLIIVRNGIEYGISSMNWVRLFYEFASKL